MSDIRPGEVALDFDPGATADASVCFIGCIRSAWSRGDCPKNVRQARERGQSARLELDPAYRAGLQGLNVGDHIIIVYWMDRCRRDLIVQSPKHGATKGTFALRSPVRPNPLALATVRLTAIEGPILHIDAIDVFDGTPLVDIKPWLPTVDVPPSA